MKLRFFCAKKNKGAETHLQNKPKELSEFPESHYQGICMNIHLFNDLTAKKRVYVKK